MFFVKTGQRKKEECLAALFDFILTPKLGAATSFPEQESHRRSGRSYS